MAFDLENLQRMITEKYTPEYLEHLAKESYENDRNYPENFSNWYPHIIDFGEFKHADIVSNQIFTYEETEIMRETDVFNKVDWNKLNEILTPTLEKMKPYRLYSIKNGCFSNKFDYETSLATKETLAECLWKINYQSAMLDTGGYTELVVREIIPNTVGAHNPTIYNGMPLKEEIRVFYNMDTKDIEYMVDYWDYDYCSSNLHTVNDRIIFDYFHNKIGNRLINHTEYLQDVLMNSIKAKIETLKFDEKLTGIWSIDFLWSDADNIYLIDMARGNRSAYWDKEKCRNYESKE